MDVLPALNKGRALIISEIEKRKDGAFMDLFKLV